MFVGGLVLIFLAAAPAGTNAQLLTTEKIPLGM